MAFPKGIPARQFSTPSPPPRYQRIWDSCVPGPARLSLPSCLDRLLSLPCCPHKRVLLDSLFSPIRLSGYCIKKSRYHSPLGLSRMFSPTARPSPHSAVSFTFRPLSCPLSVYAALLKAIRSALRCSLPSEALVGERSLLSLSDHPFLLFGQDRAQQAPLCPGMRARRHPKPFFRELGGLGRTGSAV